MVDGLVEGRVGRDGDARIALEACRGEDMDLYSRAVESGIRSRRWAVEDENREMA